MQKTPEEEIANVLEQSTDEIGFETILDVADSPLNDPVISKGDDMHNSNEPEEEQSSIETEKKEPFDFEDSEEDDDVPEQPINENNEGFSEEFEEEEHNFQIPKSHAKLEADTYLAIADNILTVGGGFFVTIRKRKEFYDFEEVIQIIDEQNEKNISRFKLDKEDKTLLRPLIIAIIRKKSKKMSLEGLLIRAIIATIVKKGKAFFITKQECAIVEERILDAIKEQNKHKEEQNAPPPPTTEPFDNNGYKPEEEMITDENEIIPEEEIEVVAETNFNEIPEAPNLSVLEVASDEVVEEPPNEKEPTQKK